MFFTNWHALLRIGVVGVCAYAALLVLLRISGKRTLSKLNAFDFVVTVALGSTLATMLLSKQTALADGILAFAVLVGLQYLVAWLSVRSRRISRLVKSEPRLLFYRGQFLRDAMRDERVTEGEVVAAVRQQSFATVEEVEAVVLETAGELSVLPHPSERTAGPTALRHVWGAPQSDHAFSGGGP
jgi:uncharacterized membrane protein YcaP (DUF421 family)